MDIFRKTNTKTSPFLLIMTNKNTLFTFFVKYD